jgi:hypothetical protein
MRDGTMKGTFYNDLLALVENKEAILAAEHDLLVVCRKEKQRH